MSWTFLLALFLCLVQVARSSGVFELRLLGFANDAGLDNSGRCCGSSTPCTCHTKFRVCLKHYQTDIDPKPPCTFGEKISPILGQNSINFPKSNLPQSGEDNFADVLRFNFEYAWTGTFSLIIDALHSTGEGSNETLVLLNRVATHQFLDVGPRWERRQDSQLTFAFRVLCAENYYDVGCTKICRPRDDKFGHYQCSSEGERVCLPGWKGDYCTKAICKPGCHKTQGYCEAPNECKCRMGWNGTNCEECVRYPGCAHGDCQKPWQCNCEEGWGGLFCNQDLNYCTNHKPCRNNGTCINTGHGSFTCTCKSGFTGVKCEQLESDCSQAPCLNGGTCYGEKGNITCKCPLGFYGPYCETTASPCTDEPCKNAGTCIDSEDGYQCTCTPEFEGKNCELQKDICNPNPCFNGGDCLPNGHNFTCSCPTGFGGPFCEQNFDDCLHSPCLNGGTCIDHINHFKCQCVPGFIGDLCDQDVDECLLQPCANGGTCHNRVNDFSCECQLGFTGKDCSIRQDICETNPCLNEGMCKSDKDSFTCICKEGYHGIRCETAVFGQVSRQVIEAERSQEEAPSPLYLILIVSLSLAAVILCLVVGMVVRCVLHRKRRRRQQDEEMQQQNEKNTAMSMNNKCPEDGGGMPHIVVNNPLGLGGPIKVVNTLERGPKCVNVLEGDRRMAGKLMDSSYDCPPPPAPPPQVNLKWKSEPKPPENCSSDDACSHKSVFVIEDSLLATEV